MKFVYKFRSSRLGVLHKEISILKILENFYEKACNCTKIGLQRGCFLGVFQNLQNSHFVFLEQLLL